MRIMMSAAASPVAPGIIRHLQMLGHTVIGHDCSPWIGRTIAERHITSPEAKRSGTIYMRWLRNFEKSYDLYLPFLDEELRLFGMLGKPTNCICSPDVSLFADKSTQQTALVLADLPIAPEAEVIVKPTEGRGSKGILRLESAGSFVVQRLLKGPEYTIDVLTDLDGNFLFAVPRERLVTNGVSVVGRIKMDDDLIELAQDVVKKFKFAGPINIQVISDREDNTDYIVEINPRLSGSCIFTVMAGFDILDATIRLHEGKPFIRPKVEEIVVRRTYIEERL
jgi:carbamoyl-phosphate synthase large subunit